MCGLPERNEEWSKTQRDLCNAVARLADKGDKDRAAEVLLRWAVTCLIARDAPANDPCVVVIKEFLKYGRIDRR